MFAALDVTAPLAGFGKNRLGIQRQIFFRHMHASCFAAIRRIIGPASVETSPETNICSGAPAKFLRVKPIRRLIDGELKSRATIIGIIFVKRD